MALAPGPDAEMVLVFLLIAAALVLFAMEVVPVDITALGVLVTLLLVQPVTEQLVTLGLLADPIYVLADPGTDRTALELGLSGFANAVTIAVLAMFILNAGVRRTGAIQLLGSKIGAYTRDSELRQSGATVDIATVRGIWRRDRLHTTG